MQLSRRAIERMKSLASMKLEYDVLTQLQRGIARAADALLLKDDLEERKKVSEAANSAHQKALRLMNLGPMIIHKKLLHLEDLLRQIDSERGSGNCT